MLGFRQITRWFSEQLLEKNTGTRWISAVQRLFVVVLFGLGLFVAYLRFTRSL